MRYIPLIETIKKRFSKIDLRLFLLAGVLLIIGAAVLLFVSLRPQAQPLEAESMAAILDRSVLRVGVRNNAPSFSTEKDGQFTGMETDIARAIAQRIFGDSQAVEFVSVDFTTRNYKLNTGQVDCVIALCPQGYNTSFLYSQPYYTDAVALVSLNSGPKNLNELAGATVGAIKRSAQPASHGALTTLEQFAAGLSEYDLEVKRYSGIPDLFEALRTGEIAAIAMENASLLQYYNENEMHVLPEAIGTIGYSVVIPSDNEALVQIADETIADILQSGEMASLWDKWGLTDYRENG